MSPRDELLVQATDWFARNGIGDTSLRGIAAGLGTSHRMLIHHFGGRDGLLLAVVERVEGQQRELLAGLASSLEARSPGAGLVAVGMRFWGQLCDAAEVHGPLFFELTAAAMRRADHALPLRGAVEAWLPPVTAMWVDLGLDPDTARRTARLALAVARGLLHDLLLTGDRDGADAAMADWLELLSHEVDANRS